MCKVQILQLIAGSVVIWFGQFDVNCVSNFSLKKNKINECSASNRRVWVKRCETPHFQTSNLVYYSNLYCYHCKPINTLPEIDTTNTCQNITASALIDTKPDANSAFVMLKWRPCLISTPWTKKNNSWCGIAKAEVDEKELRREIPALICEKSKLCLS